VTLLCLDHFPSRKNGINLQDMRLKEGMSVYKTSMIKDFPTSFRLLGQTSVTGHYSVVSAIENCCAFAFQVAESVLEGKYKSVVVKSSDYYEWLSNA